MELHKIDWENIPWEPVREGIVRKAFSGNGATLALHKLMPKHEPKPHKHTYEQIVYILAGHIRFYVGDESVVLGPGGLLQIPPDVMHWGEVVGDEPVLNLDIFTPVREEYAPAPEIENAEQRLAPKMSTTQEEIAPDGRSETSTT